MWREGVITLCSIISYDRSTNFLCILIISHVCTVWLLQGEIKTMHELQNSEEEVSFLPSKPLKSTSTLV